MNCKPGDLAVTVGLLDGNNGLIVEVVELTDCGAGWICTAQRSVWSNVGTDDIWQCPPGTELWIADVNLRPISGVPLHDEQPEEAKEPV